MSLDDLSPSQQALKEGCLEVREMLTDFLPDLIPTARSPWRGMNLPACTDHILMQVVLAAAFEDAPDDLMAQDFFAYYLEMGKGLVQDADPREIAAYLFRMERLAHTIFTSVAAIVKLRGVELGEAEDPALFRADLWRQYTGVLEECLALMLRKNHDYGDSWRYMRIPSITDQLLTKVLRLQQLEELAAKGETSQVAEGNESEYMDIINYATLQTLKLTSMRGVPELPKRQFSQSIGEMEP